MSLPAPPPTPPAVGRGSFDRERRHARVTVRMSAEVKRSKDTFTATTRDLSEGGAGIECDRALVDGEAVVLGLFLVVDGVEDERNPPLWVRGLVAWCGESDDGMTYTAGVRFDVITDDQKTWLRRVLSVIQAKT